MNMFMEIIEKVCNFVVDNVITDDEIMEKITADELRKFNPEQLIQRKKEIVSQLRQENKIKRKETNVIEERNRQEQNQLKMQLDRELDLMAFKSAMEKNRMESSTTIYDDLDSDDEDDDNEVEEISITDDVEDYSTSDSEDTDFSSIRL